MKQAMMHVYYWFKFPAQIIYILNTSHTMLLNNQHQIIKEKMKIITINNDNIVITSYYLAKKSV